MRSPRATAEQIGLVFDEARDRILFPIRGRDNALYGFSGRIIEPVPDEPKVRDYEGLPKRHLILGSHLWHPGKPLLIIEGLFGYAHMIEIGAPEHANIGAILGSVVTEEKAVLIRNEGAPTYMPARQ